MITNNGGTVSFILTKQTYCIVKNDPLDLDTYKCRLGFSRNVPIVGLDFITDLFLNDLNNISIGDYSLNRLKLEDSFKKGIISSKLYQGCDSKQAITKKRLININMIKASDDPHLKNFEQEGFNILKWSLAFGKSDELVLFELHTSNSSTCTKKFRFRVEKKTKINNEVLHSYSRSGLEIYCVYKQYLQPFISGKGYVFRNEIMLLNDIGSEELKKLWMSEKITHDSEIAKETASLVNNLWDEAIGTIYDLFDITEQNLFSKISLKTIDIAERVLYQQKEELEKSLSLRADFSDIFYESLPFKQGEKSESIAEKLTLSRLFMVIQVLRDIMGISEATNWNPRPSILSKYRSLGVFIDPLHIDSVEYKLVCENLLNSAQASSLFTDDKKLIVSNIFKAVRPSEYCQFKENIGNVKQLYHGSKLNNFMGILSRGLMLPKYVSVEYGNAVKRSDVGLLGAGVYFADNISLSLKYSGATGSSVLIGVYDVALGKSKQYFDYNSELEQADQGFHSSHGVKGSDSKFNENEYVIYDAKQCRLKYLIELQVEGYHKQDLNGETLENNEEILFDQSQSQIELNINKKVEVDVNSSLKSSSGKNLPLKSVHVRANLIDMVSQVTIYQEYENDCNTSIEAKYVFPLNDTACVCGFEAFINEKHLIGVCKEKKEARVEYRKAIEDGKGAYLMEQETNEIFIVNIGNLPSKSR